MPLQRIPYSAHLHCSVGCLGNAPVSAHPKDGGAQCNPSSTRTRSIHCNGCHGFLERDVTHLGPMKRAAAGKWMSNEAIQLLLDTPLPRVLFYFPSHRGPGRGTPRSKHQCSWKKEALNYTTCRMMLGLARYCMRGVSKRNKGTSTRIRIVTQKESPRES